MNTLDDLLLTVRYQVAPTPHITNDITKCTCCTGRDCLYFCPAACFTIVDDAISFAYEGCFECGTCRIACPLKAIDWHYPPGGLGVAFRIG